MGLRLAEKFLYRGMESSSPRLCGLPQTDRRTANQLGYVPHGCKSDGRISPEELQRLLTAVITAPLHATVNAAIARQLQAGRTLGDAWRTGIFVNS